MTSKPSELALPFLPHQQSSQISSSDKTNMSPPNSARSFDSSATEYYELPTALRRRIDSLFLLTEKSKKYSVHSKYLLSIFRKTTFRVSLSTH